MSIPKLHNAIQLIPLNDKDLHRYGTLGYWTLVEAPFLLTGHHPPPDQSTFHFLDHSDLFSYEFREALNRAVEAGRICRRYDRAGQRRFGDTPANWLAWADYIGEDLLKVDDLIRRTIEKPPPEEPRSEPRSSELLDQPQRDYEEWERQQSALVKQGKNLREAAAEIAKDVGVDSVTVERETRRVRRNREMSGNECGNN